MKEAFVLTPRCEKRAFRSERAAKRAHRGAGWRVRVYRCDRCSFFHVTNHEKRD